MTNCTHPAHPAADPAPATHRIAETAPLTGTDTVCADHLRAAVDAELRYLDRSEFTVTEM